MICTLQKTPQRMAGFVCIIFVLGCHIWEYKWCFGKLDLLHKTQLGPWSAQMRMGLVYVPFRTIGQGENSVGGIAHLGSHWWTPESERIKIHSRYTGIHSVHISSTHSISKTITPYYQFMAPWPWCGWMEAGKGGTFWWCLRSWWQWARCVWYKWYPPETVHAIPHDQLLMACIHQVNLDALWDQKWATVVFTAHTVCHMITILKKGGIPPPFPPLGPYPVTDSMLHCYCHAV